MFRRVEQLMQGLPDQQLVEGVVAHVRGDGHDIHQQRAQIAELRSGLDQLWQAHLRALGGMPGHEQCAECAPEKDGDGRPEQVGAHAHTDDAHREGGQVGFAAKPDRPQVPGFAVPLGQRHIVDGACFKIEPSFGRSLG